MESKNELKEIDIKNCTCYYFDDIIMGIDIYYSDILLQEKLYISGGMKIFWFMTFHTKIS